ncbi:MAG: hypothetical protein KC609_08325, partial [Myxococcales bacterium]|nr:hypothetical protein [Myxococcales bacterium]
MPEAVKTRGATRANRIAVALILVASVALVAVVCPACSRSSTRQSDLRDGADSDTHAPTDVAEINEPDLVLPEDMADDASDVPDEGDVPDDVVRVDPSAIPI